MRERFWERYSLSELTATEWEALCDGCGQCCLVRRADDEQVTVYGIACELLDIEQSRCSDYKNRFARVPYCRQLTPENVPRYDWLPDSCAYRRLAMGVALADWHPLIAGSQEQMIALGVTVSSYAVPMKEVPEYRMHQHVIASWSIEYDAD